MKCPNCGNKEDKRIHADTRGEIGSILPDLSLRRLPVPFLVGEVENQG